MEENVSKVTTMIFFALVINLLYVCFASAHGLPIIVGDKKFDSIESALRACHENQVINIVKDIQINNTIEITSAIKLQACSSVNIKRAENFYGVIFNILLSGDLTINGPVNFIGIGSSKEQSPFISNYGSVALDMCTLATNGSFDEWQCVFSTSIHHEHDYDNIKGGAIYNKGNCILKKCLLNENAAHDGGAIYNEGTIDVENTIIKRNGSIGDGAAIHNLGNLNALNCTIQLNTSMISGAGIYNAEKSKSLLENVEIVDNNAFWYTEACGGGVANYGEFVAINCVFNRNCSIKGGGVFCGNGIVSLINCTINTNKANAIRSYYLKIYIPEKPICVSIDNVFIFTGIDVGRFLGGGIYIANGSKISLKDTTISGNIACVGGGAYYEEEAAFDKAELEEAVLNDNKASESEVARIANSNAQLKKQYVLDILSCAPYPDNRPGEIIYVNKDGNQ